jgi:hypothetical protein
MTHAERIVSYLLEDEEQTEFPFGLPSTSDIKDLLRGSMIRLRAEQEKEHGKAVEEYSVSNHGVMQSSYWQGAGTTFTQWDEAFTGIGSNPHEALEDAINSAAQDGWDVRTIENEFNPDAGDVAGREAAEANPDMDPDEASEDNYNYVVLYVKGVPPIGEEPETTVEEAEQQEFPLKDPLRHSPETAELLKDMTNYIARRELKPGDKAISGTSIASDIIEACLEMLQQIHPSGYDQFVANNSEELEMVKNASQLEDDTPLREFQERVFDTLSEYCPPITFFGYNEADGSVGCWPDRDRITEYVDEGTMTQMHHGTPEYSDFIQGIEVPGTEYTLVLDRDGYSGSMYHSEGAKLLWHY